MYKRQKLGIGLSLAWYFLQLGKGVEISAAGAILGVTVGTVLSMVFLIFYLLRHRDRTESLDVPESSGTLMKKVLDVYKRQSPSWTPSARSMRTSCAAPRIRSISG